MLGILFFLLKLSLLGGLYFSAFYYYAPSDVTEAAWLFKISTLYLLARIFGIFLLYRMVKLLFFSSGKSFFARIFAALFALPFYAIATFLIVFCLNGYHDEKTHAVSWQPNLVYFKNFKIACIAAGIDDEQLRQNDSTPHIMLLPGSLCSTLAADTISSEALTPYRIDLSGGAFGIPYVTALYKL